MTDIEERYTIGIDIGGTFTDLTLVTEDGLFESTKAPTTPDDFSQGVLDVLGEAARLKELTVSELLRRTDTLKHGSTVATNALITRQGARVGLITTKGFGDTAFIMRAVGRVDGLPPEEVRRVCFVTKPDSLVPPEHVVEVRERIDANGTVVVPINKSDVELALQVLIEREELDAVAVSFLHSWRNPAHEQFVRSALDRLYGNRNIFLSLGSDLSREAGEYARTNTALANAYVGPAVQRYLLRLAEQLVLLGFTGRLLVMQGNGGLAGVENSAPISTLQSGPAGGMLASALMSHEMGHEVVVTADMGGTSFDVGLLSGGVWKYADEPIFARLRMLQPITDIRSIGAGGGTIARYDSVTKRMRVGPESAGASPGPACYDAGGTEPTVTDCDLLLGYLDPDYFLGGRKRLSAAKAAQAVEEQLARPLGMSVTAAAAGVFEIINSKMSDLIRQEIVRSGHLLDDCVLYAFGGAGAIHASSCARELGIGRICISGSSPVFSAHGIALSDFLRTRLATRTYVIPFEAESINQDLDELEQELSIELAKDGFQGIPVFNRYVTMHFLRQTTGEEVALPWARFDPDNASALPKLFVEHYRRLYGSGVAYEDSGLAISRIRVDAIGSIDRPSAPTATIQGFAALAPKSTRLAYFDGEFIETAVYEKDELPRGAQLSGPAILESSLTTILIAPNTSAEIVDRGNVVVTL